MGKFRKKLINLKGLNRKPSITFGRAIAREPKRENEWKFISCLFEMSQQGYEVYPDDLFSLNWWGNTICSARNKIFETALERDTDYVVFFDDDMTVGDMRKDVEKMLDLDKDIVGAMGVTKGTPHWPNIAKVSGIGESGTVCDTRTTRIYTWPDKPFEVDVVGTAFMCIKKKVLQAMKPPWFYMPPNYVNKNIKGEDTTFCFNAKMLGFEVWVDPTIQMGHIGDFAYGIDYRSTCFDDFREQVIKDVKEHEPDLDITHNLVPEVQERMKKGEGSKRMFV